MILKKSLFICIIFLSILNISFVLGVNYKIDLNNDGIAEYVTGDNPEPYYLKWKIAFKSFGGESGANLPKLSVTGNDTFEVVLPDIEYTGFGYAHAGWGWLNDRCDPPDCDPIVDRYYTFQHYPSDPFVWTEYRVLDPGTYKINMVAYGDGLNPSQIEPGDTWWALWEGKPCGSPVACRNPPCPPGYYDYIESVFTPYCAALGGPTICPQCNNDPKDCTEFDENNGYLCNGVTSYIEFYDNYDAFVWSAYLDDTWPEGVFNSYDRLGFTYITDTTPGMINISQVIKITQGCSSDLECLIDNICYEPACILNECGETPVAIGENDEACILPDRCDGAGNCVECNQASDCGTDGLIDAFQCNGNQIQQANRAYSCISNICSFVDTWVDDGVCIGPDVCYNPLGVDDCCTPVCPGFAECGDDGCGGSCGTCPPATPVCNDYLCEATGVVFWADINGEKIGEGATKTHSEIDDTVLLIYKDMGTYLNTYDFVIWEEDTLSSDNVVRTIPSSETFNYNGHLAVKWIINQTEFDKESDGIGDKEAEFYFIVNTNQSNNLFVNDTSTTPPNLPTVRIVEPVVDSKVKVGEVLNFTQIARDRDDDLKIKWTFEDGDEEGWMLNCLTIGNCNTTHSYETSGTKIIEIVAREMTRTNEAVNYSQVFAYEEGINVLAVITEPPFGKILEKLVI
jgi:hypothetical protein